MALVSQFRKFVAQEDNNNTVTMNLIDKFENYDDRNKKRRMNEAEEKAKGDDEDEVRVGW